MRQSQTLQCCWVAKTYTRIEPNLEILSLSLSEASKAQGQPTLVKMMVPYLDIPGHSVPGVLEVRLSKPTSTTRLLKMRSLNDHVKPLRTS